MKYEPYKSPFRFSSQILFDINPRSGHNAKAYLGLADILHNGTGGCFMALIVPSLGGNVLRFRSGFHLEFVLVAIEGNFSGIV